VTRDADSGRVLWRASAGGSGPGALQWSARGGTLMVLGPRRLELLDGRSGAVLKLLTTGTGLRFTSAEISPDGRTLALSRRDTTADRSEVFLLKVGSRGWHARHAFAGAGRFSGVRWSPDGRWLLVAWRDADQWLFLRSAPARRLVAVSSIGRAFEPDRRGLAAFPAAGTWCCPP
jgi:dipeptidyl aminopeptidase/acylaminoacyl peptidase